MLSTREEEKEKAREVKAEEKFRANESFKRSVLDKGAAGPDRGWRPTEERKKDFKVCGGLKPAAVSIDSSPEDVEVWSSNARLNASARNLDVLNNEDQRVLLNSILDRDLFHSLQLIDDDGFMARVDKVKIVFTGLCKILMRRVEFLKERKQSAETNSALCRRLGHLGQLANIKEVSGNDLLIMCFTAGCSDEALHRVIFKEMVD